MKNPSTAMIVAIALLLVVSTGCSRTVKRIGPSLGEDLRHLQGDLDVLPPFPEPALAQGSLWTDAGPGAALVRDTRAFRLNDLVTIALRERSVGTNESQTDLNRTSEATVGAPIAFGFEKSNPQTGSFNLNEILQSSFESEFSGEGTTSRGNRLTASITARVLRVLPNGDLVIGGQKTVMVNRERQILTLVGTVRPVDVDRFNQVPSSAVGDLTVRLWGRGEVDATVRQGWFMRVLNRIWPF